MTLQVMRMQRFITKIIFIITIIGDLIVEDCGFSTETESGIRLEYESVINGKAELPCNASNWAENDISLVLWYRSQSNVPIYTLDARTSPLSKSKHIPSDELSGRSYFDVSQIPPMLKLESIKHEDEGMYICRVDYRKSRTQSFAVTLNITVPPKSVIIMDNSGKKLEGVIGPFTEGDNVRLKCDSEGGSPVPVVTWWRGNELADSTDSMSNDGIIHNEYVVANIDRSDLMTELTCQSSNTNLTEPLQTSVILDINLKPLAVQITSPYRPLSSGRATELQCQSVGSRPPAQITWWKGSKKMTNIRDSISSDGNATFSTLSFVPTVEDNGKHLSCRAVNVQMKQSEALEDGRTLNVHFVPQLSLALGASIPRETIREGSDIYFECNILANPWVSEVSWLFDGRALFSNPSSGVIVSNQSLVIQKVKREHRGHYQCVATNSEGHGESEEVELKVHFSPICKPRQQQYTYNIGRNEQVKVLCEVDADPSPVDFQWTLNNTVDKNIEWRSFHNNGTRSVATYVPRTRQGYGSLSCWGRNEIGQQKEPCVFSILPAGPPEPLKNCAVTNHSFNSLLFECIPGDDNGQRQSFYLEVYNKQTNQLEVNMTNSVPLFIITHLQSGTTYNMLVYSKNAKGQSSVLTFTADTLAPPERHTDKEDTEEMAVNPIIIVIILISGALILVAIIIIIVLRVKTMRRYYDEDKGPESDRYSIPLRNKERNSVTFKDFDIIKSDMISGLTESENIDVQMNAIEQSNASINAASKVSNINARDSLPYHYTKLLTNDPTKDITYAELSLISSSPSTNHLNTINHQRVVVTHPMPISYHQMPEYSHQCCNSDSTLQSLSQTGHSNKTNDSEFSIPRHVTIANEYPDTESTTEALLIKDYIKCHNTNECNHLNHHHHHLNVNVIHSNAVPLQSEERT